jgi:hypothetical protein
MFFPTNLITQNLSQHSDIISEFTFRYFYLILEVSLQNIVVEGALVPDMQVATQGNSRALTHHNKSEKHTTNLRCDTRLYRHTPSLGWSVLFLVVLLLVDSFLFFDLDDSLHSTIPLCFFLLFF